MSICSMVTKQVATEVVNNYIGKAKFSKDNSISWKFQFGNFDVHVLKNITNASETNCKKVVYKNSDTLYNGNIIVVRIVNNSTYDEMEMFFSDSLCPLNHF